MFLMLVLVPVLNGLSDADTPANGVVEAGLRRALKLVWGPNGVPARGGLEAGVSGEPGLMHGGCRRRGRSSSLLMTRAAEAGSVPM
jgi:hypothetical protein